MGKIDFVITWVDGSDREWIAKKKEYEGLRTEEKQNAGGKKEKDGRGNGTEKADVRYRDWELLPYLFRGIEKYAPWVHHVFLVTDHQLPDWLDTENPKVSVVYHDAFIPAEYLPTFNSHTIELNLHRIPGLSEQFVYFNDDFFLTKACRPEDFFRHGRPVDEAALNGINGKDEEFASIQFQNISLMNRYYSTSDCRRHLWKWLYPGYGMQIIRTLLLLPFNRLQGIYNPHGPMALLKSTCKKVWERDRAILEDTCKCRFRSGQNVSPYIFRYEQLLKGNFVPHKRIRGYCTAADSLQRIERLMGRYRMVCINDAAMDEKHFLAAKKGICRLMEQKFPNKSRFERQERKSLP